jgi:hypothetical protein
MTDAAGTSSAGQSRVPIPSVPAEDRWIHAIYLPLPIALHTEWTIKPRRPASSAVREAACTNSGRSHRLLRGCGCGWPVRHRRPRPRVGSPPAAGVEGARTLSIVCAQRRGHGKD